MSYKNKKEIQPEEIEIPGPPSEKIKEDLLNQFDRLRELFISSDISKDKLDEIEMALIELRQKIS